MGSRPPRSGPRARWSRPEIDLEGVQYQLALVDYYLAQTYLDTDSPERTAALRKAAEAFNDVFQRDRDLDPRLTDVGLLAHMWHGKAVEELGDLDLATDIYDEVLANPRNSGEKGPVTGWEPWFAQVEYFRLLVVAKQKPREFLAEAADWLQQYRRLKQTDGYQGVALELAKALYAQSKKGTGPEKAKRASDARQILIEMSKVHSQYQQEAILLKREILKAEGRSDLEVATFDEAVALGDAALGVKQWQQARDAFRQALEIAGRTRLKDAARIAAVREAAADAALMLARELFEQGKLNECIEMTGTVVFEDPQRKIVRKPSAAAAQASALAVSAALNLFEDAPEDKRAAASERLAEARQVYGDQLARPARGRRCPHRPRQGQTVRRPGPPGHRHLRAGQPEIRPLPAGDVLRRAVLHESVRHGDVEAGDRPQPQADGRRPGQGGRAAHCRVGRPPETVRAGQIAAETPLRNATPPGETLHGGGRSERGGRPVPVPGGHRQG